MQDWNIWIVRFNYTVLFVVLLRRREINEWKWKIAFISRMCVCESWRICAAREKIKLNAKNDKILYGLGRRRALSASSKTKGWRHQIPGSSRFDKRWLPCEHFKYRFHWAPAHARSRAGHTKTMNDDVNVALARVFIFLIRSIVHTNLMRFVTTCDRPVGVCARARLNRISSLSATTMHNCYRKETSRCWGISFPSVSQLFFFTENVIIKRVLWV